LRNAFRYITDPTRNGDKGTKVHGASSFMNRVESCLSMNWIVFVIMILCTANVWKQPGVKN